MTRFIGGLKEEIRAPISLHRPTDVDAASALALLQEQELENAKKKNLAKGDVQYKPWKPGGEVRNNPRKQEGNAKFIQGDDKLETLKSFRKANGLCYRCGEKWGHNHKCPP